MKRYYYDDPIAAAYMQVRFKVSLQVTASEDADEYDTKAGDTWDWSDTVSEDFCDPNMIGDVVDMLADFQTTPTVHLDSLHLFHPQEGDIVRMGANRVRVFSVTGFTPEQAALLAQEVTEIIERDGKRFFWPKVEELG